MDENKAGPHTEHELSTGNRADQVDMNRMGKRQQLRRNFRFFSIFGYGVILGCSWQFALIDGVLTLPNGGTAGPIYMAIVACIGMFFVTLSMAEMASIAPTSGGQFHWTSEFAPSHLQKFLSYYVGFFCVLGWQAGLAATIYVAAQQIQAMVVVAHPGHKIRSWQTVLISWALLAIAILCNTVMFRKLPLFEGVVLLFSVCGFLAFVVVLWVMAPRGDSTVFTTFQNNGWPSPGLACLVGLNGAVANIVGADSSVHLAEELENASWVLPWSMMAAAVTNYTLAITMTITIMFCLGDYSSAVNSPTEQPFVQIVLNATGSKAGTIVLTSVVLITVIASFVNGLATISRQLWSFARDEALPFSSWLARVHPGFLLPLDALAVSVGLAIALTAIAIGSTTAYDLLLTVNLSGLLTSYLICILCIFHARNWGSTLPPTRFSLGRAGNAVNAIAIAFLLVALTFQFFPFAPQPDAAGMNWSVVIYMACVVFFTAYYFLRARHRYVGPVVYVKSSTAHSR